MRISVLLATGNVRLDCVVVSLHELVVTFVETENIMVGLVPTAER